MKEYTPEELEARRERTRERKKKWYIAFKMKLTPEQLEPKEPEKILEQPKKTHCKVITPLFKKSAKEYREEHAMRAEEFRRKTLEEKQRRYEEYKNERNKIAVPDENHDDGKSESGYCCAAGYAQLITGESAATPSESAANS